ncbi:hypothetical protein ARMGADRAFT_292178 [Armillaria gallica]|uniref:Uncharacterized protein n=1 Tax=Armillaria gallica TaxID=47427 RepID=A0A2H3D6A5_ARMGA|nr:hypothetical protein ARMGADRAFT_292178 [Armillaria gallica]
MICPGLSLEMSPTARRGGIKDKKASLGLQIVKLLNSISHERSCSTSASRDKVNRPMGNQCEFIHDFRSKIKRRSGPKESDHAPASIPKILGHTRRTIHCFIWCMCPYAPFCEFKHSGPDSGFATFVTPQSDSLSSTGNRSS